MPQVLKRILHLKQMENLYEKQMNTPSNPKYHLLDQSKMRKTLNDTQCGQFFIKAHFCKNSGGIRAKF